MKKKAWWVAGLSIVLVLALSVPAFAQGTTPPTGKPGQAPRGAQETPQSAKIFGGDWQVYDAVAAALRMTPAQLFEQLHSGKTLAQIAQAQGVEMQAVQAAIKSVQSQRAKEAVRKALANGKITQDEANWMVQGIDNGWIGKLLRFFQPRIRR